VIDLAKIAAAQLARAAIPFGCHERDAHRPCPRCVGPTRIEPSQARYEYTQVAELEDGTIVLARTFCCGSCGSHYSADLEVAPAGSVVDAVVDRRAWAGREKSGVHVVPSLSVPEDAGRYSLPGNLIDDAPMRVGRWA